ncbi:hypothetical protein HYU11_02875 [Candidatus Woesearchaeota archaeon]|nr:hypothetical protein [Candidatus Woesearchaeota archaeon]
MVTKKKGDKESKPINTISFRGNKDKWVDFLYIVKKEGHKNSWSVLEPMIDKYIEDHSNGKVPK